MSFDVFAQGFSGGAAAESGGDEAAAVLAPHIADRRDGWARLARPYGSMEVHGLGTGRHSLMFNHVDGGGAWDLIVDAARAANWVLMPIGCGTFVTDRRQRDHLPDGVPRPVVEVRSGTELIAGIRSTD